VGLRLHQSPASPFARIVAVTLREAGLKGRVEMASATGTALDPGSIRWR
jgi:glutathione S-transferase